MNRNSRILLVSFLLFVNFCGESLEQKSDADTILRVCVVEGKGLYKKAGRYCPVLEKSNSGVQCVIGIDRLDCLRRIAKGSVDFGVFSSEDLLAATWADVDILVTDELRYHNEPFEYEVVVLVENSISGLEDLRGSRFCHPGYGYEADWTETLANFFESKIISRMCDTSLSLMENKLRSSTEFFGAACKPGPWVSDKLRDRTLKTLYPNLCSLCYDPQQCSSSDKFWGRRGPLHCLTEESGNVAWARLDDTRVHFSLTKKIGIADPTNYSYLCPDGSKRPLRNTTTPCVWISKPWPVIASRRKSAAAVSALASQLSHDNPRSWQSALLNLIEFYHVRVEPLKPQVPVQDYLQRAVGFLSANSFAECNPPRSITICTADIKSRHKCDWLSEIARASGLEPQLQCQIEVAVLDKSTPETSCFQAMKAGRAEVTIAHPDWQIAAKRDYQLEPILFESTLKMNDLYIVAAVVKRNSSLNTIDDLRGMRACFPKFEGVAWSSMVHYFKSQKVFSQTQCSHERDMLGYFKEICAPGGSDKLTTLCGSHKQYLGEIGALKCLADDAADVAFISMRTLKNITDTKGAEVLPHDFDSNNYRVVCPPDNPKNCYISWSSVGHVYVNSNISDMRRQELINTFKQLDQLFGKSFKSATSPFTMYGPFDHEHNVIFQDRTNNLKTLGELAETRLMYNYEIVAREYKNVRCALSSGTRVTVSVMIVILSIYNAISHGGM